MQLQLKYRTDDEKDKMIELLSTAISIKKISKPYKSGKFLRVYIDIE